MKLDVRKLGQTIRKRQATTVPSGESEGIKRTRVAATPSEAPAKGNALIMVRMTLDDDGILLVELHPRVTSTGRPLELLLVTPSINASSSQAC